jgi:hypothetical protein
MPPSGYSSNQSSYITDFLGSCMVALILENRGIRTPEAALAREIEHIDRDLRETKRSAIETKVLELTRAFYSEISKTEPQNYEELQDTSDAHLKQIDKDILAIHVADISATN